jgi:hypothetical protein
MDHFAGLDVSVKETSDWKFNDLVDFRNQTKSNHELFLAQVEVYIEMLHNQRPPSDLLLRAAT